MSSQYAFRQGLLCGVLILTGILTSVSGEAQAEPPSAAMLASGRITATFHGLRGRDGYLRVSLYNQADGFAGGAPAARRDILLPALNPRISLDTLTVTFEGLPPGVYAVCAFHDCGGSGKLTQNFLGIPQEEWGMSGNPHPRFRAPRFREAQIDLSTGKAKLISITLHT